MFTDSLVEQLRMTGDGPADAAVAEFFEATEIKHAELFRRLASTSAGVAADEDLPGSVSSCREEEDWPDWADPTLVATGSRSSASGARSWAWGCGWPVFPADYAFAKGVQALARTARLTRNPKRRYVETGQMIIDVMTPGRLEPGHAGYRAVRHVRLMHAAVRHVLLHLERSKAGGPPVDLGRRARVADQPRGAARVPLLLQRRGHQVARESGVRLSADQAEAYVHVWNLVGHQIGILDDLLPLAGPTRRRSGSNGSDASTDRRRGQES